VDEHDLRIRTHVYASFVADGRARTPAEAAAELGLSPADVAAAYRRLHDAHALVYPFSVAPTPHRVEASGRSWFGNCAWDALGIPAALHVDARVESTCPDCGDRLELEVRDGELVRGRELLVHFVVPARRWWEDIAFT
jgi:hypothetical protein